jgi:hypothetical protein
VPESFAGIPHLETAPLTAGGADVDLRVFEPGLHGIRPQEVDAVRALVCGAEDR